MAEDREALLGRAAPRHEVFPWLVKFLDANDWLSVQVHPDEEAVRRLWPGEGSKTEAWLVLDVAPGSRIYAGLVPGMNESALRQALRQGTVADCLHQFTPRPGDCVFLPAGTVHAVGGGVLMAEVQQTSDATFRLFDWNRRDAQGKPRTLHIEQALASIHWDKGPVTPVPIHGFADEPGQLQRLPLVRCRYFQLDYVADRVHFACGGGGRLKALLVIRGRGRLVGGQNDEELIAGQSWVLPAALAQVECVPEPFLGVVLCSLPDDPEKGTGPLKSQVLSPFPDEP
jgi:mannose-6-phosphate isomerase